MSSRHDHFPRANVARRLAMRRAVSDLDAAWRAADAAPDGLVTAIAALADASADVAIARLLPWLADTDWLRGRLDAALALLAADPFARPPPRPLRTGETLILDTARQSFTLQGTGHDVLLLELTVQPPSRLPIRAYDIASGRLTHISASRRDSSFRQMALALLRQLGRTDAAPLFIAETASEDFAARWNAMRELVALDPAAALPHLAAMAARDPHPEVRRAAAATHALFSLPSGETGRERGGGPGPCTSPAPSTPKPAPHTLDRASCRA